MFVVDRLHRVRRRQLRRLRPVRRRRDQRRGRHDLLLLHRPGRRLHRRRRGEDPQKTMPRAIIGALFIVIAIYLLVADLRPRHAALAGLRGPGAGEAGLAKILENITGNTWPGTILAAGAVISIFSVTLVTHVRADPHPVRDGPRRDAAEAFAQVNPRTQTPVNNTIIVAIVVALLAAFVPLDYLWDVVSIGTLIAFIVVSLGVIILRAPQPDLPRGFKVPLLPGHPDPVDHRLPLHPVRPALVHLAGLRLLGRRRSSSSTCCTGRKHSVLGRMLAGEDVDADDATKARRVTVLVGYVPHKGGRGSLDLGLQLAHALGTSLAWSRWSRQWSDPLAGPGRRRVRRVRRQLARAGRGQGEGVPGRPQRRRGDRLPRGHRPLGHLGPAPGRRGLPAPRAGARLRATDGAVGRIVVGSTTDKLLHSSPVPLALSPRGYPLHRGGRLQPGDLRLLRRRGVGEGGGPGGAARAASRRRPGWPASESVAAPCTRPRSGCPPRTRCWTPGGAGVARPEPAAAGRGHRRGHRDGDRHRSGLG